MSFTPIKGDIEDKFFRTFIGLFYKYKEKGLDDFSMLGRGESIYTEAMNMFEHYTRSHYLPYYHSNEHTICFIKQLIEFTIDNKLTPDFLPNDTVHNKVSQRRYSFDDFFFWLGYYCRKDGIIGVPSFVIEDLRRNPASKNEPNAEIDALKARILEQDKIIEDYKNKEETIDDENYVSDSGNFPGFRCSPRQIIILFKELGLDFTSSQFVDLQTAELLSKIIKRNPQNIRKLLGKLVHDNGTQTQKDIKIAQNIVKIIRPD